MTEPISCKLLIIGAPYETANRSWSILRAALNHAYAGSKASFDHPWRRSDASPLINRGTDAEIIRELLGHADLRMTLRAYAHLLNRTVAKVVKRKLPSFRLEPRNVRELERA
jgi:site-specific recombinase XerD